MKSYDYIVIGAGAAGLAAISHIKKLNPEAKCAIIERDTQPGGILLQCIHTGFGLSYFKEEMTGPEYAQKAFSKINDESIAWYYGTTVTKIFRNKTIECYSFSKKFELSFDQLIMATGSREVPLSRLAIPSQNPAGIFAAGELQLLVNRYLLKPSLKCVILGAGDIGLIMARRLIYEGMEVEAIIEINEKPSGVLRNVQTCVSDFNIELIVSSTIVQIHGYPRVQEVTVAKVDNNGKPIFSELRNIRCDFLVSAIGLIPEIGLAKELGADISKDHLVIDSNGQTSFPWLHVCGNAAKIYPIVDEVSENAEDVIRNIYAK